MASMLKIISRIAFSLAHPEVAAGYILFGKEGFTRHQIPSLTGLDRASVDDIYAEILNENGLEIHIRNMLPTYYLGQVSFIVGHLLYTLCRLLHPRIVVETGVSAGVSTAFILKALEDNSNGLLHSIDMPKADLPVGQQSGFVIPDYLRTRWRLHIGVTSEILPKLLSETEQVDIFLHDSEHTYENMLFEYETTWPSIRQGGLLLSDDTNRNGAFRDFAERVKRKPHYLYGRGYAGLRK